MEISSNGIIVKGDRIISWTILNRGYLLSLLAELGIEQHLTI